MSHGEPRSLKRALTILFAMAAGLLVLTFADKWIWAHVKVAEIEKIQRKDWYQFLRQLGSLYIWGAAAAVLIAHDIRARGGWPALVRGGMLFASAGLGGLGAELVKIATQRYRPGETGEYLFSWMMDGERGPGFGLASSHAGVAFGAAFMLARLFPGTGCVAVALAVGCGMSRLLVGAHFATDVYVAACLSYGVAAGLWRLGGGIWSRTDGAVRTDRTDTAGAGGARPPSDFE